MKTPLAMVAMLLFTASGFAFDQRKLSPKICGSVEQYEQERIWENLPGCVNVSANRCESGNNNCINYGGRAVTWEDDTGAFKAQFMTFYNAWDSGDYEGAESAASIIGSNLRDLVRDAQAGREACHRTAFGTAGARAGAQRRPAVRLNRLRRNAPCAVRPADAQSAGRIGRRMYWRLA